MVHSPVRSALSDPERLRALAETELLDSEAEGAFNRLTRMASRLLGTPVALVSLVDDERQFFKSAVGLSEPWAGRRQTPLTHSLCQHVVTSAEPLIVADARRHPVLSENLAVAELGVVAYAGVPLVTSFDKALGALCVIDEKPRAWSDEQLAILRDLASSVVSEIELRVASKRLARREAMFRALTESVTDAIVTADASGNIVFWNAAAEMMFGYSAEQALGRPLTMLMPARYHEAHGAGLRRVAAGGEGRLLGNTVEIEAVRNAGSEFPVELSLASWSTSQGTFFTGILRDISTRKMQADALQRTEEQLQQTIDHAPIGMALVGLDGRFVRVNKALCEIHGYSADELVTRTVQQLTHADDLAADLAQLRRLLAGDTSGYQLAKRHLHRDGSEVDVMLHVSLLRDRKNAPLHFICQVENVTHKRRAEAELAQKTMILESVLTNMNDGVIVADRTGKLLLVNPAAQRMLGKVEAGPATPGQGEYTLYAADAKTPLATGEIPLVRAVRGEHVEQCEMFVRTRVEPEGRWHSVTASPLRHTDGTIWGAVTVRRDITRLKSAELALREQTSITQLLEAVAAAANEAPTSKRAMQDCLRLVCSFMGWPVGHAYLVHGASLVPSDLWHLSSRARFAPFREATSGTALAIGQGLSGRVLATGKPAWLEDVQSFSELTRAAAVSDVHSGFAFPVFVGEEVVAVLEFYSDRRAVPDARTLDVMHHVGTQLGRVFERDRHAHQIRDLSLTDELTGLHNRRGFLAVAQRQLRLSARTGKPVLLLFLDMDGLKQINDHLGHEAGDAALVDLAAALRRALRETDLLARLGGDEFVALLPDSAERDATTVTDRLAATLARHNELAGRQFVISVSVGVACADPKRSISIDELLSRADGLMYEQKRQKKSSVTRLSALR